MLKALFECYHYWAAHYYTWTVCTFETLSNIILLKTYIHILPIYHIRPWNSNILELIQHQQYWIWFQRWYYNENQLQITICNYYWVITFIRQRARKRDRIRLMLSFFLIRSASLPKLPTKSKHSGGKIYWAPKKFQFTFYQYSIQ